MTLSLSKWAVAATGTVLLAAGILPAHAETTATPATTPTATATATVTPSVTPSVTPTLTATPSESVAPSALKISARAESACSAATWTVQGLTDNVPFQVSENVDGKGWEPVATTSSTGFAQHAGAEVIAFRVTQGQESNETGPIALNLCDTPTPTPSPTPTATSTASPTPTASPSVTPAPRGTVTAKYECGAAHFTNNGTEPVTIYAGTVDSDSIEARFDLAPGKSRTVESTNKTFGWIAWANGVQAGDPAGYLGAPGEDLSCDEPDDSATPTPTATPGESRGLANTGGEGQDGKDGTTSVTITINGTKIDITMPGNGKPVITTNGETVTPDATPSATPDNLTPTPTSTPSPAVTPTGTPTDDTQDDELADQQAAQGEPAQADALNVADEIFQLTNQFRTEHGLKPFERDTCLDGTAQDHSGVMIKQMADQGDIFHSDLTDADNCPNTEGVGENIAAGQPDAATAVEDWKNSKDGHREAMLSTDYTRMGVGVTTDNTYTQQFA